MSNFRKNNCYSSSCGPIVRGGFHLDIYYVCRQCKCEVTEKLKEEVDERIAIKEENDKKPGDDDGFGGYPW